MSSGNAAVRDLRRDAEELSPNWSSFGTRCTAYPELGLQLPRTQEKVLTALRELPLDIVAGRGSTSVTAVPRGARARSDRSAAGRYGRACGRRTQRRRVRVGRTGDARLRSRSARHDAGGAAQLLAGRRDQIAADVVLMFQPGEDGFDGALHMIEEGVLEASGTRPVAA